uniref:Unannotated protein n=1 Tax=freshwater metagenome TaxID=449393 RepID=A0A6J5ZAT9_9ZZZZ
MTDMMLVSPPIVAKVPVTSGTVSVSASPVMVAPAISEKKVPSMLAGVAAISAPALVSA